jgi:hypothetical protein
MPEVAVGLAWPLWRQKELPRSLAIRDALGEIQHGRAWFQMLQMVKSDEVYLSLRSQAISSNFCLLGR